MTKWWGLFEIPEGEARHWRIGPLSLWLKRSSNEWVLTHLGGDDLSARAVAVADATPVADEPGVKVTRFAARKTDQPVTLEPILPDRSVVTRPETPFSVVGGETVSVLVSLPVWVKISAGDTKTLAELPTYRISDTWFGPSTREGELCYASNTRCRRAAERGPAYPHRAICQVSIANKSDKTLAVDRISIPATGLTLFATPAGELWTQKVVLVTNRDGDEEVRLTKKPPREAASPEKVQEPRKGDDRSSLVRALGSLIKAPTGAMEGDE